MKQKILLCTTIKRQLTTLLVLSISLSLLLLVFAPAAAAGKTVVHTEFTALSMNSVSATSTGLDGSNNPLVTVAPLDSLSWSATSNICTHAACKGTGSTVPNGYTVNLWEAGTDCAAALTYPETFATVDTKTTSSGVASDSSFKAPSTPGTYCFAVAHPSQNAFPTSDSNYVPTKSTGQRSIVLVIQVLVQAGCGGTSCGT